MAEDRYEERKMRNDASRGGAEHHAEDWDAEEIALLEECWADIPIEEIAETLGRTIEACRQKHYEIGQGRIRRARAAQSEATRRSAEADRWTRGFTSLEDMERHYGER